MAHRRSQLLLTLWCKGHFAFSISRLSLRLLLSPKFGLRPKINQKCEVIFRQDSANLSRKREQVAREENELAHGDVTQCHSVISLHLDTTCLPLFPVSGGFLRFSFFQSRSKLVSRFLANQYKICNSCIVKVFLHVSEEFPVSSCPGKQLLNILSVSV